MIVKIFGLFCLLCLVRGQGSPCCTKSSKFEVMEGFTIGSSQHGQGSYTEVSGYSLYPCCVLKTDEVMFMIKVQVSLIVYFMCIAGENPLIMLS